MPKPFFGRTLLRIDFPGRPLFIQLVPAGYLSAELPGEGAARAGGRAARQRALAAEGGHRERAAGVRRAAAAQPHGHGTQARRRRITRISSISLELNTYKSSVKV